MRVVRSIAIRFPMGSRRVREGMRVVRGNPHGAGAALHMFKPREGVAGQFEKICTARSREEG